MPEQNLVVRFSVKDSDVVRRALTGLGDEGQRALARLERAAKQPNDALKLVNATSRELQGSFVSLAGRAGSLGNVLGSIGPKGLAAAAAIGAVAAAATAGLRAFAEEERALLRLDAVLRATGGTAALTRDQMSALAETLERSTFFKKEDILQAEAALASFKAVSGDAFESTIRLATDLAEVFGGDVVSNARILGKALQDPTDGLSALKRVAGELPPDIQAAAKALEDAGRKSEAVALIIGELESRFGGSAQAAAEGYAGAVDNLGDAFDDLFKSIGQLIAESGLEAYLRNLGYGIDAITEAIQKLKGLFGGGRSQAEWEQFSRENGFVTSPTFVNRNDPNNPIAQELRRRGLPSVQQPQIAREVAKHTESQAKSASAAAKATKEQAEAQKAAERAARETAKAYEEMYRPISHALDRVQDSFADVIAGGKFSASELVNIFKRAGAEIAAAMIFRPIISGITGSLFSGASGSLAGGGGISAGGGGASLLSGGSSALSGLLNGWNTPLVNPGIAFDIGSYLGLGGSSVGALHTALGNFTPLSGIASFGGGMLGNALFGGGGYSGAGSTIGGIAGTAFGGPIGGFIGSLAGSALGSLFGKQGVIASEFAADVASGGGLSGLRVATKNGDPAAAQGLAGALNNYLAGITTLAGSPLRNAAIHGAFNSRYGNFLEIPAEGKRFAFDPGNEQSINRAIIDLGKYLVETSDIINTDFLDALNGISTEGKTAAEVLQKLTDALGYVSGLEAFADALTLDAATTNLSPEALYQQMSAKFSEVSSRALTGNASLDEITTAAMAFLNASKGYTNTASSLYATDLSSTQATLRNIAANSPHFAGGGDFGPGFAVVGEQGPELVRFNRSGTVIPSGATRQIMNGDAAAEMRAYRDQSAMETMQLRQEFSALRNQFARLESYLMRVAVA